VFGQLFILGEREKNGLEPIVVASGAAQYSLIGRLCLLRQVAEMRIARRHGSAPFLFARRLDKPFACNATIEVIADLASSKLVSASLKPLTPIGRRTRQRFVFRLLPVRPMSPNPPCPGAHARRGGRGR
jgi:hypothetical protein